MAWALYDALNEEIRKACAEILLTQRRQAEAAAVMDSLQRIRLQRELLPELTPEPQGLPVPESLNLPQP